MKGKYVQYVVTPETISDLEYLLEIEEYTGVYLEVVSIDENVLGSNYTFCVTLDYSEDNTLGLDSILRELTKYGTEPMIDIITKDELEEIKANSAFVAGDIETLIKLYRQILGVGLEYYKD